MKTKVKKALKITGIVLGSFVGLILIVLALVCYLVFSSSGLTNVAEKAIEKYSPARAGIDKVDLTLVSSFPYLAFRLNGLVVYDDMEDSPYDTLAAINKLAVTVDFKSLYKTGDIILTNLFVDGVHANMFTATDGRSNIDVFGTGKEKEESQKESGELNMYADLQKISLDNVNASYSDLSSGTDANIRNLDLNLKGLLNYDSLEAKTDISVGTVSAQIKNDSTNISANLNDLKLNGNLTKYAQDVNADITLSLKKTNASLDRMNATVTGLKLVLDKVGCTLGKKGPENVTANLKLDIHDVNVLSPGMDASTGTIALNAPNTIYTGDSAHVSGLSFQTRSIAVQLEDSIGSVTKATLDKIQMDIDGGMKLNMSNVTAALLLALEDIRFEMGGETPLNLESEQFNLNLDAGIVNDDITLNAQLNTPSVLFAMNGDTYVPGWSFGLNLPVETNKGITRFNIREGAGVNIDGQKIGFNANGTLGGARKVSGRARVNTVNDLDIDRLISMIPDKFKSSLDGIDVHGLVGLDVNVKGGMGNNGPILDNATASVALSSLDASVNDSIKAASDRLTVGVTYPSVIAVDKNRQTADLALKASNIDFTKIDSTTINAYIDEFDLNASAAGLTEAFDKMNVVVDIRANRIEGDMDTISGTLDNTLLSIDMAPADGTIAMKADVAFDALSAVLGSSLSATLGQASVQALAQYDSTKHEILNQWKPQIKMTLDEGQVNMLQEPLLLKALDFDFSLGKFNINDCRVELDDSDIQLWGDIYNIGEFVDGNGLLTGELFLESDHMNINKLMELTGGSSDSEAANRTAAQIESGKDTISSGPIMIPKGIDLTLFTNLYEVDFNNHTFNNVGGDVSIKDGVIILQELGFSSNAAEMQLTAIYRTPNVEDRFMELDFHLLDIEIDELINLIPSVDSIVPMLKSLSGKAQFHFAAQTYLEPDYVTYGPLYPQMSSLISNAVIEGANLVVLDNTVFDGIKRKLLMSKDARAVIDSLDVELQVLDGKVDLYPTRIKMDRYEAIVSGRHNIDAGLNCNYNISLVKCPLPIRLGVTISGPLNDIAQFPIRHIKVGRAKYDKLYSPVKGKADEAIMRRKNAILEAGRSNVRPRPTRKIEN